MKPGKAVAAIGLAIGVVALALQFGLTVPSSMARGRSLAASIVFFLSFFTILSNIGLVLVYLAELWHRPGLRFFREPVHRAALAAAIVFVMAFSHVMLAESGEPRGLSRLVDVTLHYVTPGLFILWWLRFVAHKHLHWDALPRMLAYPVLYVIWAMARGAVVNEYPYPVFEAHRLGYAAVLANLAFLFVLFAALSVIVIVIDKLVPKR